MKRMKKPARTDAWRLTSAPLEASRQTVDAWPLRAASMRGVASS